MDIRLFYLFLPTQLASGEEVTVIDVTECRFEVFGREKEKSEREVLKRMKERIGEVQQNKNMHFAF